MDLSVPPIVTYALAWFGFMGGIWALFDRAETVASADTKAAISTWLRNLDVAEALANWPAQFAQVFDYVFGKRHLSWRCFYRSCIASIAAVIVLTLIWAALRPNEFLQFIQGGEPVSLALLPLVVLVFNLIPAYFSLLETRYLIHWMAVRHSTIRILVTLFIDLVATLLIFHVGVFLLVLIVTAFIQDFAFVETIEQVVRALTEWFGSLDQTLSLHREQTGGLAWGIFLYSTFFTSAWVWLYALSGVAVKSAGYLGVGISGFKKLLDVDEKPIRSLGFVSMLLVTAGFIVLPFAR